ncbi:hypothetical protein O181_070494 [Austropuccinia psidii MF-1]|uniref:Uncharacterized protein n=1 Tax=Austropuccinia psidii MF-1 TaxID=1389203 RepID=A0A9Q3F1C9_9BASI|nr:hypothetical protein [Austropuccinia psidii MF-1]
MKHNVVIPESTISSNTLWLKFAQFVEQTQKEFERLCESISSLQEVYTLQTESINTLKEAYTEFSKASEDTKRRLNQVLEEKNHCKSDKEYLNQDIYKLFNFCQKMKPQTQGHVSGHTPYHQEDIKPEALLEKKPQSQSQYQDGHKITYSEKEALKQLPEASSWPKYSSIGEYDNMELIDYIVGLFTDVPSIQDYWITSRLNTAFKGHASIWYTEMKEIHGKRNLPWIRTSIGRYNTHSTADNREKPTLEAKEAHDSEYEITTRFHSFESPNHYAENPPKDREEIFASQEETRKDQECHESDSDSVGNGCGNNSYSESNPHEEYLVDFENHGTEKIGAVHSKRRKR